jgi:hypothetical protein
MNFCSLFKIDVDYYIYNIGIFVNLINIKYFGYLSIEYGKYDNYLKTTISHLWFIKDYDIVKQNLREEPIIMITYK